MTKRQVLGLVGSCAAAGMTVVWVAVVPDKADTTDGLQSLLIRWGHPATWAALAALGLLVALDASPSARKVAGAVSLGAYAAFLAALVL